EHIPVFEGFELGGETAAGEPVGLQLHGYLLWRNKLCWRVGSPGGVGTILVCGLTWSALREGESKACAGRALPCRGNGASLLFSGVWRSFPCADWLPAAGGARGFHPPGCIRGDDSCRRSDTGAGVGVTRTQGELVRWW